MKADMGGTELFAPLQHVFSIAPTVGFSRNIFVLTDGEVHNPTRTHTCRWGKTIICCELTSVVANSVFKVSSTEQCLNLVKKECSESEITRIFSFGIGCSVRTSLSLLHPRATRENRSLGRGLRLFAV
jgi:hypothetical protein